MKRFYRICKPETKQSLWYDYQGNFTGLIHNEFNFCNASSLAMDFDKEIVGYLSATDSLESLYQWFSKDEIINLQKHGFYIHVYETDSYKFYDRFQHLVINQANSKVVDRIILN